MRVRRRARVVFPQEEGPEMPRRMGLEDMLCRCVAFTLDEEIFSRIGCGGAVFIVLGLKRRKK